MKIGLVGYQGSGKSTLFHWLTGVAPDPALTHTGQSGMAAIPDPARERLCQIYHPKKVTLAAIELVDTPGMSRSHEGNAARLAMIREAGCLVFVVAAFERRRSGRRPPLVRRRPRAGRHGDRDQPHPAGRRSTQEALAAAGTSAIGARARHIEDRAGGDGVGQAAPRVAHDRRAAEGTPPSGCSAKSPGW